MLDSIYHMSLRLLSEKKVKDFVIMYATLLWKTFHNVNKICGLLILLQALFDSQKESHMIKGFFLGKLKC